MIVSSILLLTIGLVFKPKPSRKAYQPQLSSLHTSEGFGISLGLFASQADWDYQGLLNEIYQVGARQIMIVVPINQESHLSNTPSLGVAIERIRTTLGQAKTLGFNITLMPVIKLRQRQMNYWRGTLAPTRPNLWWSNYRVELKRLASLAKQEKVERLIIGAELCSLEHEYEHWADLIQLIRQRFPGALSYSANWDHYQEIKFWPLLDELAVTAYVPIARESEIAQTWQAYLKQVTDFAHKQKRPLLISEYGYPALDSAMSQPWNETTPAALNTQLQSRLIKGSTQFLLKQIRSEDVGLKAAFLWNWFGFGAQKDRGFSPRKREAEQVLKQLLSQ